MIGIYWASKFSVRKKLPTLTLWSKILRLLGLVKDVKFVYEKENKKWIKINHN